MKRENIAERGIWTAKKRYILNVWDSEGVRYEEPKLKMMGIEAVKSSTPAPCRTMIKDALKIMMNGTEDEVIDFIDKSRKEFKKLPPEDIAFPRSASNVEKYKASSKYMPRELLYIYGVHYCITIMLKSISWIISTLSFKMAKKSNSVT